MFKLNRRNMLIGAPFVAAAPLGKAEALPQVKRWLINPWRQRSHGDALLGKEDILHCEFIKQHGQDTSHDNWLEVFRLDGTRIQSELLRYQPGLLAMMADMQAHGVVINVIDVEAINVATFKRGARLQGK